MGIISSFSLFLIFAFWVHQFVFILRRSSRILQGTFCLPEAMIHTYHPNDTKSNHCRLYLVHPWIFSIHYTSCTFSQSFSLESKWAFIQSSNSGPRSELALWFCNPQFWSVRRASDDCHAHRQLVPSKSIWDSHLAWKWILHRMGNHLLHQATSCHRYGIQRNLSYHFCCILRYYLRLQQLSSLVVLLLFFNYSFICHCLNILLMFYLNWHVSLSFLPNVVWCKQWQQQQQWVPAIRYTCESEKNAEANDGMCKILAYRYFDSYHISNHEHHLAEWGDPDYHLTAACISYL